MIKIVHGVYGYVDKNGIVRPKTEADEPFELLPEQEKRLVRLGVAEYVRAVKAEQEPEEPEAETEEEQDPIGVDETPPVDIDEADVVEEIVDLETLSAKELHELGNEYGLTFKSNASKASMIKAITEAQKEDAEDEDGEPAPVFDASEAVQ